MKGESKSIFVIFERFMIDAVITLNEPHRVRTATVTAYSRSPGFRTRFEPVNDYRMESFTGLFFNTINHHDTLVIEEYHKYKDNFRIDCRRFRIRTENGSGPQHTYILSMKDIMK